MIHFCGKRRISYPIYSGDEHDITKRREKESHYLWMLSTVTRRWPTGRMPRAPTYKKGSDVTGIIGNTVPGNSGLNIQQSFSSNYPQFEHAPSKKFSQLCSRPKEFNQYQRPHVSTRPCVGKFVQNIDRIILAQDTQDLAENSVLILLFQTQKSHKRWPGIELGPPRWQDGDQRAERWHVQTRNCG